MADEAARDATIEQLFGRFAGDLWIKRRLQLGEVVEHLEQLQDSSKDSTHVEEWIRFVKFLDTYCSGKQFINDKQWGELMNHMQISRRLNHRSVKFRDILRNHDSINFNQRQIKRLNELTRLVQLIEGLFTQLDSHISKGSLNLINASGNFILAELSSSREYLRDKCQPLLNTLRVELLNDTIRDEPQLENWKQLANRHESTLGKVDDFVTQLSKLQRKLLQLGNLIGRQHNLLTDKEVPSSGVSGSIDICKLKYRSAYKFNEELINTLTNKCLGKGISFVKIISLDTSHAYSKAIAEACATLDDCDSKLAQLIKDLRVEFGRFYFVSDLELLTIIGLDTKLALSQESSCRQIIGKLFSNSFERYLVDEPTEQLIGVQNCMGEEVHFLDGPILLRKRVKIYSMEIVRIFNETIRKLSNSLKTCLAKCFSPGSQPPDAELPVQVILLRDQINFSTSIEEASKGEGDLNSLREFYELKLKELSRSHIRNNQTELDRYKSSSVISFTIYFLSILRGLQSTNIGDEAKPDLLRHLRYYFDPKTSQLKVKIGTSTFDYGFEYLPFSVNSSGNRGGQSFKRLINTRINELSFLVASAAISTFKLGANPYGPAGCGKTETIKALGHLLGYQVVVHNCDETNDSESLDRIISGLAQTGLWGCFDEFNRLSYSTLSAFSSRLELVQGAIREGKSTLETEEGQFMRINPSTAFFVTLNPGGDNTRYKGRRNLPANLRHLFMPIAMTQVEVETIFAELLMTSNGLLRGAELEIDEAQALGGRLSRWISDMQYMQMGGQRCEWDLRMVMAILKRLERLLTATNLLDINDTDSVNWNALLQRAIKIEIEPRLTAAESELMNCKLEVALDVPDNRMIEVSNKGSGRHLEFQLDTHTGVILVGPTTSGKSFSWRKLHSERKLTTKWLALNPKSCKDLLGNVDPSTEKWSDGLFTALVRKAHGILLEDQSEVSQVWIVLDGPIDPDWIESLNSVLDDNQILTLGSGERLGFVIDGHKCIKLIFEVCDVSLASPATISRLGLELFENKLPKCNTPREKSCSSLEDFFHSQDNFCIVVGSSIEARLCLLDSYSSRYKVQKYYCSEYSTSSELQELMLENGSKDDILLLSNVHLIESDDRYGTRSFVELLRFMITYKGYYDLEHNFHQLKARLIITLDCLDQLEERCQSQAEVIYKVDSNKTESTPTNSSYSPEEYVSRNITSEVSCVDTVVSFVEVLPQEIQKQITAIPQSWKIYTFQTRSEIHESIRYLEELLNRKLIFTKEKSIFVLKSIECNSMSELYKSKLYHLLNKFKMYSQGAKFIYFEDGSRDQLNSFWSSIGPVYSFKKTSLSGKQLELYLEEKFNSIPRSLSISSKNWLVKKVVSYMNSAEKYDAIHMEQLSNCIVTVINEAFGNMEQKHRILSQGLCRLNTFSQNVEIMRVKCESQEKELKDRKCMVEELMIDVNDSIETAQNQRDKIELLKRKHSQRTDDIKAKSSNIEKDLKLVADMVEDSKVEIEQYLKPEALNEIKSLREAPKTIKDILEVLFLLLGVKDLSWASIKSNLAKGNLRDDLTKYDARRRLNANLLGKVELLMKERKSSFSIENATRASKAVIPIIGWIRATLEYGKMLVKLQPLTKEMDSLSHESASIIAEADELRKQLAKLDSKIAHDNRELDELNKKYEESRETMEKIKCQLSKAENIAQSLETQKSIWEKKLARVNLTLKDEGLTKLCLASSLLVVVPAWTQIEANSTDHLTGLLTHCELAEQKVEGEEELLVCKKDFVEKATNLFLPAECLDELVVSGDDGEEVSTILCLMIVKLCLLINVVPFIEINNLEDEEAVELRLVKTLQLKQVLCPTSTTIPLCKMSLDTNTSPDKTTAGWSESLNLNIRLGRLMCVKLAGNQYIDLEVANIISTTTSKAAYGNADNNRLALILAGKLSEHPQIGGLVRAVDLPVASYHSSPEIQSKLLECLVSFYDPQLNQSIRQHEHQLETKQAEVRDLEWRLLNRLAASTTRHTEAPPTSGQVNATAKWELDGDLVDILNELQQSSRKLAIDVSQLSVRLAELKRKQTEYLEVALKAEKFYSEFLQALGNNEAFYSLPLDKYCSLVLKSLVGSSGERQLDYSYLATRITRSMRSQDSKLFVARLREKQLVHKDFDTQPSEKLKNSLLETIQAIQSGQSSGVQLMVVVHDSTESSPQLELDEIVQNYNKKPPVSIRYTKINATSGKTGSERIQQAIELGIKSCNRSGGINREEVECVCIGNAQLMDLWLNTWLLELLRTTPDDCKVLVLLIAEASGVDGYLTTSNSVHGLSPSLLSWAHVKVWYDESGLNLPARFKLLTDRLLLGLQLPTTGGSMLEQSIRRLVLLHVVCQERSMRCGVLSDTGSGNNDDEQLHRSWLKPYVFDYNQLRLASKSLHWLLVSTRKPDWEVLFCHHLRDIIYGPRLETYQDQHQLALLVGKLIEASSESPTPNQIVDRLDALLGKDGGEHLAGYEKCLSNLVSTSTSWKQADWCNN